MRKRPVICLDTGEIFPSMTVAALEKKCHHSSMSRSLKIGCRAGGYHWDYHDVLPETVVPGKSTAKD
eukprot:g56371.t1